MRLKWITTAIVVLVAAIGYTAWRNGLQPAVQESGTTQSMPPDGGTAMTEGPSDPGIEWKAPAGWTAEGARSMRLATYTIPGEGDGPSAECAVYYFGPGQGGSPDANVERWLGEFDNPQNPQRSTKTIHGLRVSRARARGAYRSHGGSVSGQHGDTPTQGEQQLLGAIVEGPQGPVFFKLTGPSATIDRAAPEFDRMIGTVRKK